MQEQIRSIIHKHEGLKKNLIAILLDIQSENAYLPPEALRTVASELAVPLIDIVGLATFYRAFSLKPRGRHLVTVCLGTACHVRGGPKILSEFEKRLAVEPGETTPDKQFTLETVACLGCCAIGPVVVVDRDYYGHTTIQRVNTILKKYQRGNKPKATKRVAKHA
ncbi:MAG: NADH-quinone oxidoreductase subunit NuoE [Candidatus Aminicenantes bacterium]|nr:NADH-quinone oxidoreductase subunit NuoE [Candidatus Aminicenantes bacterium]